MNFSDLDNMETALARKGINDAVFGEQGWSPAGSAVDVEVVRTQSKSLSPEESYARTIAVHSAVNAIAKNISKAKIRIFTRSGREVTGGPLYALLQKPAPGMSTRRWLLELVSWYNIRGEFANLIMQEGAYPEALLPLNPALLEVDQPTLPRDRASVSSWRYTYADGAQLTFSARRLFSETMFNPLSAIRGLPPTDVGQLQIGTDFHANRYNRSFYENDATPSYVFVLPEGTPQKQLEQFKRELLQRHSTYLGKSHTAAVVAGKDVHIETINDRSKDGSFLELLKQMHGDIAMLYHVPAIEMGIYDKSRFDTAAEERKLFVESTLMPEMEAISEALQQQLVNPYPWSYSTQAVKLAKGGACKLFGQPSMAELFEKALAEREGDLIVLLDPDTLPIMAAVKASMIATAKDFRRALDLTAQETIEYFGLDIAPRPERQDVWIDANLRNITHLEMNAKLNPTAATGSSSEGGRPEKPAKEPAPREQLLALRKLTLRALDDGELWSLAEADALCPSHKTLVRQLRHALKAVTDAADPKRAAKDIFNRFEKELP
jgi:HK97 family phage portal protein